MRLRRLVIVFLVAGVLAGCGASAEEKALRESLVRVDVAIKDGVSLHDYSLVVREVATRNEIAKPKLSESTDTATATALEDLKSTQSFWETNIACRTRVLTDGLLQRQAQLLKEAGKIDEAHALVQQRLDEDVHCSQKVLKAELDTTDILVQKALKALPAT